MQKKYYFFTVLLLISNIHAVTQVVVTKDVDYIHDAEYDNGKDLLDIYMPKGKKNVPVIVYFHGGALMMGDKSWGEDLGMKIAASGIGLISVNYRLSPDFQHPSHFQDAAAATSWVMKNIDKYGGNPEKTYVGGHSAGGYLAALIALDSSRLKAQEIAYPSIAGAILISPFLYVEETAPTRIARDTIYKSIWGDEPQSWIEASVTPHILPHRDNILLIYADGDEDWRKEQNERFAAEMKAVGNSRLFVEEVPNRDHLTLLTSILKEDDQIVKLMIEFVTRD